MSFRISNIREVLSARLPVAPLVYPAESPGCYASRPNIVTRFRRLTLHPYGAAGGMLMLIPGLANRVVSLSRSIAPGSWNGRFPACIWRRSFAGKFIPAPLIRLVVLDFCHSDFSLFYSGRFTSAASLIVMVSGRFPALYMACKACATVPGFSAQDAATAFVICDEL